MQSETTTAGRLSVSIVLYNTPQAHIDRALRSLQRAVGVARAAACVDRVAVYVVDNSTDPSRQRAAKSLVEGWPGDGFFQLSYRAQPQNLGFGAGHNSVISDLDSDYHLVLNPDVELSEEALRVGLTSLRDDSGIALVSPRVSADNGRQEFLCKRYPSVLVLLLRAFAPRFIRRVFYRRLWRYEMRDVCSGSREAEIMLASGCFMLVRTRALLAAGGFDDAYFLYFEDFDLSLRLGGQGRLIFNPAMRIVHHGGYAARKGMQHVKYFLRSGVMFFNQHGWRWI
jgi:GT2 family glycosyltransferase